MSEFERSEAGVDDLAGLLVRSLNQVTSLNDYLSETMPALAKQLGTDRICLVDYYEQTDHFDLIYFEGYPHTARFHLQRLLATLGLRQALGTLEPFRSALHPEWLLIPCRFREILESVVAVETPWPAAAEVDSGILERAKVISRFLGLFMSSSRLEVNRSQLPDLHDLQRARQIQLNFLPRRRPPGGAIDAYGFNCSSNLVGGDYYDYFDLPGGLTRCVLADACGHGLAAALTMSNFRGLLQSEADRQEIEGLFERINTMIHFEGDLIQYLTGVFLHLDPRNGRMRYVNAGHYEPIVLDRHGKTRQLPGGGPPLGMFKSSTYPVGTADLGAGDLIVLFTDGLVDLQSPGGDYFGTEGILQALGAHPDGTLEEAAERIMSRAREFSGQREFEDDVTLFLVRAQD